MLGLQEFVNCYGYPRHSLVTVTALGGRILARDPDRYAAMMVTSLGPANLQPGERIAGNTTGVQATSGVPVVLNFGTHGTLVQDEWVMVSGVVPHTFLVSEMRALKTGKGLCDGDERVDKKGDDKPQRDPDRGVNSRPPSQPATVGLSHLSLG